MGWIYDNFVLTAIDIIPIILTPDGWKILFGWRNSDPEGWWTIGQMIQPGESPAATISRILVGLGLKWSNEKIEETMLDICGNSCVFATRKQPPKKKGRHCFILVFALNMEEQDVEEIVTSREKYSKMKWFFVSEIDSTFDPVIQATVKSLKLKLDTG